MNLIEQILLPILKQEGGAKLDKALLIPGGDLHKVAVSAKAHALENQADPALQDLTDAQWNSIVKCVDQATIGYVRGRLHI